MNARAATLLAGIAALFFAGAPAVALAAPAGVHLPPTGHPPLAHIPIARPAQPAIPGSHGPTTEPAERFAPHLPASIHPAPQQIERPIGPRRPFLPWWFRRRPMAAPELPLF